MIEIKGKGTEVTPNSKEHCTCDCPAGMSAGGWMAGAIDLTCGCYCNPNANEIYYWTAYMRPA